MDPHKPRATDATQLAADAATEPHPATLAVHAADADLLTCGGATPLYLDNAFSFESAEALEAVFAGRAPGYVYSRIANPTVAHLERVVAALEGGIGAVACASGMAAISSAVLALAGAGDEIVAGSSLFGGTHSLFRQTLSRYGITTRFVSATDPAAYEAAINERTRALFVEVIGNPRLDVPDLAAIGAVARAHGVALLVDSTAATPMLVRPGQLGAAIVIHSTSKFLQGHGTAIGGIIVDCGTFDWSGSRYGHLATLYRRARQLTLLAYLRNQICRDLGCCLAPFNAFLTSMGVQSLGARMARHCDSALEVARWLRLQPEVCEVRYPGLPDHPDHALATRQFGGRYGALLTVRLADRATSFRFINALTLARNLANIGDASTLVIHPASTFYREIDDETRRAAGVSDGLVRLSIGLEEPTDIIDDLRRALAAAHTPTPDCGVHSQTPRTPKPQGEKS